MDSLPTSRFIYHISFRFASQIGLEVFRFASSYTVGFDCSVFVQKDSGALHACPEPAFDFTKQSLAYCSGTALLSTD